MENKVPDDEVISALGLEGASSGLKYIKLWIWLVVLLAVAAVAVIAALITGDGSGATGYVTEEAHRGDLVVTVTATGTLQPVNQVDVGTEVSGTIRSVEVDYNDRVKVGQVLAKLDTDALRAQVLQSRAALESAEAGLVEAQAAVFENRKELEKLRKARELSGGKIPSERDLDTADAALRRAEAQEATAKAQIAEAKARLSINENTLSKAVIRSPIDGVVLDRKVEPGQTVAASLQAPVLFTLAETLTQMELHVDIDEADVGQVETGQSAVFTVDAYPEKSFNASITAVRYAPKTAEGVVTYEALLAVDNSDLLLRPGMTATADITVKHVSDALLVPNAALRFAPPEMSAANEDNGGLIDKLIPRRRRRRPERRSNLNNGSSSGQRVWVLKEGRPEAVSVKTGATDGKMTEVLGGEISPGETLVVDVTTNER